MTNDDTPRRAWIRERAVPLAKQGLPPGQITKKLLGELPRGFEDSYLAPGITKEVGEVLKTLGLRPNVGKAKTPSAAEYKQLEAFDYDEIVAFAAHRDAQMDADERAKLRDLEAWCKANPGHTVEQIVSDAKQRRAKNAQEKTA